MLGRTADWHAEQEAPRWWTERTATLYGFSVQLYLGLWGSRHGGGLALSLAGGAAVWPHASIVRTCQFAARAP
eukprot:3255515-Prymnesium_polylepis.1